MYLIAEGRNFLALEHFEDAVGSFERAVSALPEYPIARAYFAAALVAMARLDEAKAQVELLRRNAPGLTLSYMRNRAPGDDKWVAILDLLRQAGLPE